ncbi:MAG: tail fiber domain-containing protein [Bacteroides sp.]|nr:tail fiber domain-containing protein [Bacteroides sp.]
MKKLVKTIGVAVATLISVSVNAQVSVESDGSIKMGDLSKAKNASGNSLDIAVNKIYVYTTNNGTGSFSIYNDSEILFPGLGGGSTLGTDGTINKAADTRYNRPTYIEPKNAGRLILGTSNKPLGSIYAGTVYSSGQKLTSDRRAKLNIHGLENSTAYLRSLKPVRFDFNREVVTVEESQAGNKIGFIAQDVEKILPELVSYDTLSDLYSMDYVSLIPVLTKGFQEQDSVIRRQQALLEAQAELMAQLAEQINALQELLVSDKQAPAPKKAPIAGEKNQNGGNVLYQNQPNPFNMETKISYGLAKEVRNARIVLYDMNGAQLKVYELPLQSKGELMLQPGSLSAGIYLYGLVVDGVQVDLKRMVLMN